MGRRSEKDKFTNEEIPKDYHKKLNRKLAFSAVGTPDYVAPEVQGRGKFLLYSSRLYRNCWLVVNGSHSLRNVSRISTFCFIVTKIDMAQDPKLEKISCHPKRCWSQSTSSWFNKKINFWSKGQVRNEWSLINKSSSILFRSQLVKIERQKITIYSISKRFMGYKKLWPLWIIITMVPYWSRKKEAKEEKHRVHWVHIQTNIITKFSSTESINRPLK